MMYLRGNKPSSVIADTNVGMKDGYHVFTTAILKNAGLGFIIRWRVVDFTVSSFGAWNSPGPGWPADNPMPSVVGLEYWRLSGGFFSRYDLVFRSGNTRRSRALRESHQGALSSYGAWGGRKSRASEYWRVDDGNWSRRYYPAYSYWAGYYPQIQVRYVKIGNVSQAILNAHQFTVNNLELVDVYPRPDAFYTAPIRFLHNLTVRVAPIGTCTTPSVAEGTVHFAVDPASFPNNQWGEAAYKDFTLTFSNCPRVNVKYYVHANGTRWVGGPGQSVVGVQGSVPGDPNPITGNPRGFAIQLQHRTGNHQHSGNVYIHPNEQANPLSLPATQSYTRNWQGAGTSNSSTGVTHTIPLRAHIVRTGDSSQQQIQPGPFNTSVIVAIQYP